MASDDKFKPEDEFDRAKIRTRLSREDAGLLRKLMDKGLGVISSTEDGVRSFVGELTLPRELMNYFITQIDRTKHDVVSLIGREVSQFLQATNVSDEVVKALSQLEVSINADIKFKHVSDKDNTGRKASKNEDEVNTSSIRIATRVTEETDDEDKPAKKTPAKSKRKRSR